MRRLGTFYGHFAAAYGTCWLFLFVISLVTQSKVNAGEFGMWGFPLLAGFYAAVRLAAASSGAPVESVESDEA
ncbi:MAG: hypothetical protein K8T90_13605 [Planctomycetes bacterium]|nr:hypothetical protein [Planctomycetota bacterium]